MKNDARFWMKETLERFNCESLDVKIFFNKRFTARMGDATYSFPGPRIRLSEPMWPMISQAERRDTVIHETCHIVVMHEDSLAGRTGRNRSKAHGPEWRQKMRACGLEPARLHDFDVSKLPNSRKKFKLYCSCDTFPVTKNRLKKVLRGEATFRCRKCGERLSPNQPIKPAIISVDERQPQKTLGERVSEVTGRLAPEIRKRIRGENK